MGPQPCMGVLGADDFALRLCVWVCVFFCVYLSVFSIVTKRSQFVYIRKKIWHQDILEKKRRNTYIFLLSLISSVNCRKIMQNVFIDLESNYDFCFMPYRRCIL